LLVRERIMPQRPPQTADSPSQAQITKVALASIIALTPGRPTRFMPFSA